MSVSTKQIKPLPKNHPVDSRDSDGFTLLELLISIVLVGVLSAIAIPSYTKYVRRARLTKMATTLAYFEKAFEFSRLQYGRYPNDSHVILPPEMAGEISDTIWLETTPIGGNYNWEGPDRYPYAGVSILGATAPASEIELLDRLVDNGDLNSGRFRLTPNGRYTYIFME